MTQLSLYLWLSTRKVSIRSVTSVSVSLTSVKCDTHTSSLAPALAKFISTIAQPHPHPKSWTWMSALQRVPSVLHWQSTHTLPGLLHLLSCQEYWRDSLECAAAHSSSTSQSDGLIPPPLLHLRRRPNSAKAEVLFLHLMLKGPLAPCLQRPLVILLRFQLLLRLLMAVHSCAGFPQHTWCSVWWWFCCSKVRLDVWDQTLQWLVIPEQHTWACWGIWCGEKNVCFGSLEPTESSLAFCCWDWQCQDQVHQGEEVAVAGVQTVDLGPVQSGKSLLPIPPAVHICLEAGPLVVQLAHFKSWLDHRLEVLGQNQGVTGSKHSAHLEGLCCRQLSSKLLPCSLIWC